MIHMFWKDHYIAQLSSISAKIISFLIKWNDKIVSNDPFVFWVRNGVPLAKDYVMCLSIFDEFKIKLKVPNLQIDIMSKHKCKTEHLFSLLAIKWGTIYKHNP